MIKKLKYNNIHYLMGIIIIIITLMLIVPKFFYQNQNLVKYSPEPSQSPSPVTSTISNFQQLDITIDDINNFNPWTQMLSIPIDEFDIKGFYDNGIKGEIDYNDVKKEGGIIGENEIIDIYQTGLNWRGDKLAYDIAYQEKIVDGTLKETATLGKTNMLGEEGYAFRIDECDGYNYDGTPNIIQSRFYFEVYSGEDNEGKPILKSRYEWTDKNNNNAVDDGEMIVVASSGISLVEEKRFGSLYVGDSETLTN